MRDNTLRIGVVTSPHGVRGEVKVFPTTDDVNRFKQCDEVILDYKGNQMTLHITSCKFFKNMVILKFKEFDNRDDIEKYRKCDLLVTRENAVPLEEGEFFICDIIGAKVVTEDGEPFGTLKDVLQTGANDVYVVEMTDGKEVLLPKIDECIKKVDVEQQEITVHIMKGLLE